MRKAYCIKCGAKSNIPQTTLIYELHCSQCGYVSDIPTNLKLKAADAQVLGSGDSQSSPPETFKTIGIGRVAYAVIFIFFLLLRVAVVPDSHSNNAYYQNAYSSTNNSAEIGVFVIGVFILLPATWFRCRNMGKNPLWSFTALIPLVSLYIFALCLFKAPYNYAVEKL